ncbi:MAG: FAD-dependent thymidylate synthase [Candidatus Micrarchaeia archaeon]
MQVVEPKVYLIAETKIIESELKSALRDIGGDIALKWYNNTSSTRKSDGEYITEVAGRICYKSFGLGLNPNVTRIREDSQEYISNTLSKGDGSIFEHATCTFAFIDVSRVFTHELVRHRAGVAISQESLRYVRPSEQGIGFWLPEGIESERKTKIISIVENIEKGYKEIVDEAGFEGKDFKEKKELTSLLRRILPQGMATNIIWTANHRTIRHVITMRTSEQAEIEIRMVFDKVAEIMRSRYPLIYADFEPTELEDGTKAWKPKYVKA